MIMEFRVSNYLSIKDETVFSMEATSDKKHNETHCFNVNDKLKLLKVGAIFGANASGKTNLLKALSFMRKKVINSKRVPSYEPFKFQRDSENSCGLFELTFFIDKIKYIYGFKLTRHAVMEEWLYYYPENRRRQFFVRVNKHISGDEYDDRYEWGQSFKGEKKKIADLTKHDNLFLSNCGVFKLPHLNSVFNYFGNNLKPMIGPVTTLTGYTRSKCEEDEDFKAQVIKLMRYADFDIKNISVKNVDLDLDDNEVSKGSFSFPFLGGKADLTLVEGKYKWKRVMFTHEYEEDGEKFKKDLELYEESMGTSRWFGLMGPLLDVINTGGVLIVDEIEASLHTDMVLFLLRNLLMNADNVQIIFNTHDLLLLDLEYLRRDEIWFTERKKDHSTDLFALVDFRQRNDKNILNGYRNGIYGARPLLKDYFK